MIINGNVELTAKEEEIRFLRMKLTEYKRNREILRKAYAGEICNWTGTGDTPDSGKLIRVKDILICLEFTSSALSNWVKITLESNVILTQLETAQDVNWEYVFLRKS